MQTRHVFHAFELGREIVTDAGDETLCQVVTVQQYALRCQYAGECLNQAANHFLCQSVIAVIHAFPAVGQGESVQMGTGLKFCCVAVDGMRDVAALTEQGKCVAAFVRQCFCGVERDDVQSSFLLQVGHQLMNDLRLRYIECHVPHLSLPTPGECGKPPVQNLSVQVREACGLLLQKSPLHVQQFQRAAVLFLIHSKEQHAGVRPVVAIAFLGSAAAGGGVSRLFQHTFFCQSLHHAPYHDVAHPYGCAHLTPSGFSDFLHVLCQPVDGVHLLKCGYKSICYFLCFGKHFIM